MALFRPGAVVGQVSGRIGGVVFARNRGGPYVRNGPAPNQPQTAYQIAVRAALSTASSAWKSLDAGQRLAWKAWAESNPITNRIGERITLQGNAAYLELNSRLAWLGVAPTTAPPTIAAPAGLLTLALDADIGAGDFDLTYTATPLGADTKLWIEAVLLQSASINFLKNRWRIIGVSAAAQASPFDIQAMFTARVGTPAVGNIAAVRVSVISTANGQISAPLSDGVVVTST